MCHPASFASSWPAAQWALPSPLSGCHAGKQAGAPESGNLGGSGDDLPVGRMQHRREGGPRSLPKPAPGPCRAGAEAAVGERTERNPGSPSPLALALLLRTPALSLPGLTHRLLCAAVLPSSATVRPVYKRQHPCGALEPFRDTVPAPDTDLIYSCKPSR